MKKPATTEHDLHDLIKERWSPRAFNADAVLTLAGLAELFEAARWAPSSNNSQPWRFLYGIRGDETFAKIVENLKPNNARWAFRAGALAVAVARTTKPDGSPEGHGLYDTGQAVAYLSLQAQHKGLSIRQMGGFLPSLGDAMAIPANYRAMAVLAIGNVGDATVLADDELQTREAAPRARRSLGQTAHHGGWSAELEA